ncbi:hypothetical protein GCM10010214_21350 [Streptomyces abikoensis]|nr:hypothetical protein GCM10010214_21350 [Streptomyces abikoensis]
MKGVTMAVRTRPKGVCGVEVGAIGATLLVAHREVPPRGVPKGIPALPARGFKQCRVRFFSVDEGDETPQYGHLARWSRSSASPLVDAPCGAGDATYGATRPFLLKAS